MHLFYLQKEDHPLGRVIPDLFLTLERRLAGLEIDRVAQVLDTLQNAGNGFVCPLAGISRRSVADRQALFVGVGRGVQDVVLLQPLGDLRRPQAVHAQGENLLHDSSRFLVHNPAFLVLRVFHVPIGRDGAKVFAGASLGLPGSLDFLAGVLGKHLVKYVPSVEKKDAGP